MEDTVTKILDGETNPITINNNLDGITTKVKVWVKIHRISRVGIKETNKDGTIIKTKVGVQIKVEIIKDGAIIQIKVGLITKIKEQTRIKVGETIRIKEQIKPAKIRAGETIRTMDGAVTKIPIGMLIKGLIMDGAISQETTRMDGVINLKTTRLGTTEKAGDYFSKSA